MMSEERQYVIGTAGHIDHGKTALVHKLTGINTDRLKEEQERGITIDLGFAHLSKNVTIIDVPGHERLIKNMVAGVSTIDLVIFVVAADDGIMPQTREHLDIVKLLGIKQGIFVITKTDLVDQEWISLVQEELQQLLKGSVFEKAPIVKTSVLNDIGIDELRLAIHSLLNQIDERLDDGIFRLPVDRSFTKAGFGNIVTGSVISGEVKTGDTIEILPEKITARVRGLHSHDEAVKRVSVGYRAALNITGIEHIQIYRGQVITEPRLYEPVTIFNAAVAVLAEPAIILKNQMRIRIHLHTGEYFARIIIPEKKEILPGENGYAQFRLERSVYASYKDKFILRQYSPQITFGGGYVLETNPLRYRKKYITDFRDKVKGLESQSASDRILACFSKISPDQQTARHKVFKTIQSNEDYYFSIDQINEFVADIEQNLKQFHQKFPGRPGKSPPELQSQVLKKRAVALFQLALDVGVNSGILKLIEENIALASFHSELPHEQQLWVDKLENLYQTAGYNPPLYKEVLEKFGIEEKKLRELITILRENKKLIPIDENIFFHVEAVQKAIDLVRNYFLTNEKLQVPKFKDLTNTTRKFAIPLLNYLDNNGYTTRDADIRLAGPKLKT
jgi:selenocysteine-specific elongation factor